MGRFSQFDIHQWLPKDVQRAITEASRVKTFADTSMIYSQGDEGADIFRVLSGSVRLLGRRQNGREFVYFICEVGDCFGLSAVVDGEPRPQTAETLGETKLQATDRGTLRRLRETYPVLNDALLRLMTRQRRLMSDYLAGSQLDELSGRVVDRILGVIGALGVKCKDGVQLSRPVSQADLALMIGTSRQSINKALRDLQKRGLLSVRYRNLVVHDLNKLENYAHAHRRSEAE